MPPQTSLSVIVPAYNEQYLVATSLGRLEVLRDSPNLERVQVVVVDDSSRDSTGDVLASFAAERGITLSPAAPHQPRRPGAPEHVLRGRGIDERIEWIFVRHAHNGGKGAAVRTGLVHATCDLTVIHDADLEYHPRDVIRMVKVFVEEGADAVFGSRFAGGEARRALLFRHELGNRLLTFVTNLITNVNLTDIETCYKAVRTPLLKSIPIVSNDFRLEPELTIKLAKREARIFEVPISYSGRTYNEGKKIGWKDGVLALLAMVRFWLSDDLYAADDYGSHILSRLSRAPRFNEWMADVVRPWCGRKVLEIGSGTGNLTRQLVPRDAYVASDINPLYLQTLRSLTRDRPYLDVTFTDVTEGPSFPEVEGGFDTAVCLNVLEHVEDDVGALRNIRDVLAPCGRAIVLVPRGPGVYGTLDELLGHKRRYTRRTLRQLAADAGFEVTNILSFNRFGTPAWWLNGKLLRRSYFGLLQIKLLNLLTPVIRRVDGALPFPPLSLIAVLEKSAAARDRRVGAAERSPASEASG